MRTLEAPSQAQGVIREKIIQAAKSHKASWMELGQYLFTVYKEKLYKNWSFLSFEAYCQKELGIKPTTASKLLKSYYFLEKEEPLYVREDFKQKIQPNGVPDYNSVHLLRLAKENKEISTSDYAHIRKAVLDKCQDAKEVRAEIKKLAVAPEDETDSIEIRNERRKSAIKKIMSYLGQAQKELESQKFLPVYLLRQMEDLRNKLEDQIK